jgi:hypothetical protein
VSIAYQKLKKRNILLEGTLLEPSITMAGVDCPVKPTLTDVAAADAAAGNSNNLNIIVMIHYINKNKISVVYNCYRRSRLTVAVSGHYH